jgi:predicted ATPase/class 3 adenylate cyclase
MCDGAGGAPLPFGGRPSYALSDLAMNTLPAGTVTLLFTDIEGSTHLLQELGRDGYVRALSDHRRLLRTAFSAHGGVEVEMQGDSFHFAFPLPQGAALAAAAAQRALAAHRWEREPIRVRIGLHTGTPLAHEGLYAGLDVHRAARVMSAGHGGQVLLSETTGALVAGELPETVSLRDLGEHRLKDLSQPQRLYQLLIEGLPSEFPPLKTLAERATNLPVQPNRIIGRQEELAAVTDILRARETRLLTLTGPGGTGKTRLALQAAAELTDSFPDGVFVVFLASLRDPHLVHSTVAQALGLKERVGETLDQALAAYLHERELLLLLDNFEHLLEAAPAAADLLGRASALTLLVTSREPLHVAAEQLFEVPPLAAPTDGAVSVAEALGHDSVALFVERAKATTADFELSDANVAAVSEICARLDGLPLALELAAARSRTLSPEALRKRLNRSLTVLTGGARDADERQRTLRSAIEWSHDLLSEEEQALFARLSVFAGGCRPDAGQAVCYSDGIDVLDGLSSLADKSLARQRDDPDFEPRYWMLETIREYAHERLETSTDHEAVRHRHAAYFAELAERAEYELRGPEQLAWLGLLDTEQANVRAALQWSLEHDPELALRLAGSLYQFWEFRGVWNEGIRWAEQSLERAHRCSDRPAYARALFSAGFLTQLPGRFDESVAFLQQARLRFEASNDLRRLAHTLSELAWAHIATGEIEKGEAFGESARSLATEIGETWVLAHTNMSLAAALTESSSPSERALARADALNSESVRLCQEAGDEIMAARVRGNLGWVALIRGDYGQARALFDECLRLANVAGDELSVVNHWSNLALVALFEGDADRAEASARRVLERILARGDKRLAAESLHTLSAVAARRGDFLRAGRLLGAAEGILANIHVPPSQLELRIREQWLAPAAAAAPAEFEAARAQGRAMSVTEAARYALVDGAEGEPASSPRSRPG